MKGNYEKQHKVALLNPYKSIVQVLDGNPDNYLVGIKNVATIPNTLMHKLEPYGFSLHTIDKKSQLAGRAIDTELINPITGHIMSGSSSGTAINVFAGINDLGIGNDGGGSVLAPAICVNIIGFISKLIEEDRLQVAKKNTDGMTSTNSIGFMSRSRDILLKAIEISIDAKKADDYGVVYTDKKYDGINCEVIDIMECHTPRVELTNYLKDVLNKCDVFMIEEGPIDLYGIGDSLFGHFDDETKKIQEAANKGYVRVCNIAGATALALPDRKLGCCKLLMCESKKEKISKLLKLMDYVEDVHDELIERYFLDLDNYFIDGYKI